ncbi:serine/threonine protein kinase [Xylariaceae sp. FL0255]|nr:serine/threonine protein kinase [Xylariaceae sp. FL0255]
MSIRSPLSPKGFVPLGNSTSNAPDGNGIPLTQIKSNASTGARKADQGLASGFSGQEEDANEKHGFFHRGRRHAATPEIPKPAANDDDDDDFSLNAMGKIYNKIIHASVTTRYLIYIIPVAILLAVPLIVLTALNKKNNIPVGVGPKPDLAPGPPLFRLFVWFEVAWLTLWAGKLGAWLTIPLFTFFTGVVSPGTRKYATVLQNLQIPLSLFFWALADWLVFMYFIEKPFSAVSWPQTLTTILGATFISAAIFLSEKAIIQLISISYHQRSFANRIQDSKRDVYLLGLLFDASRKLFPMFCDEFIQEDEIINDSIEMLLGGKKGRRNNRLPARLIGNVGRFGNKVTSAFGAVATEVTGKHVFNPNSAHSIVIEALEKQSTSEALAKRIWMSFVVEGNESLFPNDIAEVLGPNHETEAEECFGSLDADSNGDVSLDEMIIKVADIGKERKAIANSMKDIGQALGVLDKILLFVVLIAVIFVFLTFFNAGFVTKAATAGTALLSLSFAFSVTAQEFLGSTIFLFVKHPFDVGDRVDITGSEKEALIVERISLLYTIFTRIDKMQVVQIPNIVLNSLWIENVSRSKAMKELITINVSYDTTFEDIELLRLEMERFVRHPDNSRDFQPDIAISVGSVGNLDQLQLNIAMKHKSNWHNDAVRATRRSKFMCALVLALKKVPMYGPGGGGEALGGPTNPTYSVSVSDMEAAAARDKAAKNKDAARLVPLNTVTESAEVEAAKGFNTVEPSYVAEQGFGYNREDEAAAAQPGQRNQYVNRNQSVRSQFDGSSSLYLQKSESQRSGLRKAGETLPPDATRAPSFQVTQHMTPFDEEAQVGGPNPYAQQPLSPTRSGNRHRGASVSNPQYSPRAQEQ